MTAFIKMHGLGNDFVLLPDCASIMPEPITPEQVRAIAHRTQGLGCDQLIALHIHNNAPHITFYNADGSQAGACGNGSRCVAGWWFEQHPHHDTVTIYVTAEDDAPPTPLQAWRAPNGTVRIEAGRIRTATPFALPNAQAMFIDIGNPHVVVLCDSPPHPDDALANHARALQSDSRLPHSANIGFAYVQNAANIMLLTYERGVGFTQACGTNACATAVACATWHKTNPQVTIHMAGGALQIQTPATPLDSIVQQGAYTVVASGVLNMLVG
jgi:diaminopimelate epimerase